MRLYAERTVPRSADQVAQFWFDASNNPLWQTGMRSCEWETPPPVMVGSTYRQEASFLGRDVISRFRVVELDPGRSIKIETIESTFPITVTRTVESLGDGRSRVIADIEGAPRGLMALLGPLTRWFAQRSVDRDYDRLVEILSTAAS